MGRAHLHGRAELCQGPGRIDGGRVFGDDIQELVVWLSEDEQRRSLLLVIGVLVGVGVAVEVGELLEGPRADRLEGGAKQVAEPRREVFVRGQGAE